MATGRGTKPTLVAWGLAGVPILATFVQTMLAMVETTLGSAGLGSVQETIRSVPVFDAAAILMWKSPSLVLGLFVLIAGAWVTQGVAQFGWRNRDVTFAAAGLVSVLFFALFLGVYAPMFGEVPTGQAVGFFAVPFLASGAAVGAALVHDWDEEVVEAKTAELAETASELDRKRERFEEQYRNRIGDLDALTEVAPNGVESARRKREEFLDRCDGLDADLGAADGGSADRLRSEAASLRSRVADLDPDAEIDRIDDELRDRVASGVRTTYGTIQYWSRYDGSYELVNLPGRFREVDIPAFDATVHLDRVDEAFLGRIEDGLDLQTVAAAVGQVDAHVERVETHVAEREVSFAETVAGAESDLETVEAKVERFDGRVADRLSEVVLDGRHEQHPGVRDVRGRLDEGKDALHDCRFDEAERTAEDAAADASDLVTLVEFLWSVVGTVDHGGERVSLPGGVDPAAVEELGPAFESEYDVDYRVADGAVRLTYRDAPAETPEETDAAAGSGANSEPDRKSSDGSTRAEQVRPEEIIDSVLFVFRELKQAGRKTENDRAELQTDNLPESVATPAVLTQIERFGQRQTDVVESIDVQENAPPGFLELVPKDGTTVERAVDALHERYREQHG